MADPNTLKEQYQMVKERLQEFGKIETEDVYCSINNRMFKFQYPVVENLRQEYDRGYDQTSQFNAHENVAFLQGYFDYRIALQLQWE